MQKNVANQKWIVFAFNRTTNAPVPGDSAQITAKISIDAATAASTNDTNPTELEGGYYYFNLTQAETNGDMLLIIPESSTSSVQVIGVFGIFSTVAASANNLNVSGINTLAGHDPGETIMGATDLATEMARIDVEISSRSTASALATVDTNVDAILVDTSTTIPAQISALNDLSQAEANAACDQALADYDGPTNTEMEARTLLAADYFNPSTDEVTTDAASRTASQADVSNLDVAVSTRSSHSAADVWISTTRTLSSFGTLVADTAAAVWAAVSRTITGGTVTADNMRGTDDAATATALATVDTNVDAILVDTGTTIPAQISALNNISAAEVNAEVVDALSVDTYVEPGQGAPASTISIQGALAYLYKWARNRKTQTATQTSYYDSGGTVIDQKQTVSDDGSIAEKGAMETGP